MTTSGGLSPAFSRAVTASNWSRGRVTSRNVRLSISRCPKRSRLSRRAAGAGRGAPSSSRTSPTTYAVSGSSGAVSAGSWCTCQTEAVLRSGRSANSLSSIASGGAFSTIGYRGPNPFLGPRAATSLSGATVTTSGRGRTYSGRCRASSTTTRRAEGRQKRQRSVRGVLIGRNRTCYSS